MLLRNESDAALPSIRPLVGGVAVIGPNAIRPAIQGGGSAVVMPVSRVHSGRRARRRALAGQAEVTVAPGCQTWVVVPEPDAGSLRDPSTGEPGLRLEFRDRDGGLLGAEHRTSTALAWWDQIPAGHRLGPARQHPCDHVVPGRTAPGRT